MEQNATNIRKEFADLLHARFPDAVRYIASSGSTLAAASYLNAMTNRHVYLTDAATDEEITLAIACWLPALRRTQEVGFDFKREEEEPKPMVIDGRVWRPCGDSGWYRPAEMLTDPNAAMIARDGPAKVLPTPVFAPCHCGLIVGTCTCKSTPKANVHPCPSGFAWRADTAASHLLGGYGVKS